jgi:hypothetical protein
MAATGIMDPFVVQLLWCGLSLDTRRGYTTAIHSYEYFLRDGSSYCVASNTGGTIRMGICRSQRPPRPGQTIAKHSGTLPLGSNISSHRPWPPSNTIRRTCTPQTHIPSTHLISTQHSKSPSQAFYALKNSHTRPAIVETELTSAFLTSPAAIP